MKRRCRSVTGALLIMIGLLITVRVLWVGYGPPVDDDQLTQQVRFLEGAIERGETDRMQQLFPEGAFFLEALTALSAIGAGGPDLHRVRGQLRSLESAKSTAVFGSGMEPEHGIFHAGWTLFLAVDIAEASGLPQDRAAVGERAAVVHRALVDSPTPFLAGYPGQFWPCDTVVAMAALARAADLLGRDDWLADVRAWRQRTQDHLDPATGLLPHRTDATGRLIEGSRGSSQSIIQTFAVDLDLVLDGRVDHRRWQRFVGQFVVRRAGLVGVAEYPHGAAGRGDVDSGPLIFGVSASASAVTLAAARRAGDRQLAEVLDREAELLGLPMSWPGGRSYAFGRLPVGDAFLAFARSREPTTGQPSGRQPAPLWPLFALPGLLLSVSGVPLFGNHRDRGARLRPTGIS